MTINKPLSALLAGSFALALGACSPEVGSNAWCEKMKERPKGEWTGNEVRDFTKHCLFNRQKEE